MTTNKEIVWKINRWILANPEMRTLLDYDGTGIRPIFAAQTEPESDIPYLRYTHRIVPDADMWWMHSKEVTYAIFDIDADRSAYIQNVLIDMFQRQDESAAEFRRWLADNNDSADHEVHSIQVLSALSPDPVEQEGGRHSRYITIRIRYSPKTGKGIRWS